MNTNQFNEHEVRNEVERVQMELVPSDPTTVERIAKLHPKVRDTFAAFVATAEQELNIKLRVSQGLRTIAEQNALYAQGRSKPGRKVTNAKGGQSYHNYGLAIDLVQLIGSSVNWQFKYELLEPIATRFGIEWGGNFKSILDRPHFQITFGFTTAKLKERMGADGYPII